MASQATEEQLLYANILNKGMLVGLGGLFVTFTIYCVGILKPIVPLDQVQNYWVMPVHEYLEKSGIQAGWSWLRNLKYGDMLNFLPIAFLSLLTILCYLAIIPGLLRKKDSAYVVLAILEVIVLVVAASGILEGEEMTGSLLLIASYISIVLFLATLIHRAAKIARMPHHLRWELAPIPREKGKGHYGGSYLEEYEWWTKPSKKSFVGEAIYLFKEIVLLKEVWKNNRKLWNYSFPFHFGMYLLIGMAFFLLIDAIGGLVGITQRGVFGVVIKVLATAGFIAATVGALGLIASRLIDPNLRKFNTGGTFLNLLFLLVVFLTGLASLISVSDFPNQMTAFVAALFTLNASVALPGVVTLHCLVGLLFLAYLPFTRMLHFVAKYFTYHEVRWNDAPVAGNARMERDIEKLLSQPVTWAAPHLKADGKKNWVDIVTEETKS